MRDLLVNLCVMATIIVVVLLANFIATEISAYRRRRARRIEAELAKTQAFMQWANYRAADQMLKTARDAMTSGVHPRDHPKPRHR